VLRVIDIQTVSIAVASASVTVAAIYYVWQIRHQTRMRQTDLVMKLYSEAGSKEFLEATHTFYYQDFKKMEDIGSKPSLWVAYQTHCMFFERVGILLHRKLIDIDLIDDLFSIDIKHVWEKVKPLVEENREGDMKAYYEWFEYLYNEMKKREQKLQQSKV
jgi:hypothetical protein